MLRSSKIMLIVLCSAFLAACGGGTNESRSNVTVSLAPGTGDVKTSQTLQFSASVSGTTNTAVIWRVNGTGGGSAAVGSISGSGLYRAPATVPSPATVTISAVSVAEPTASGSATVTITAGGIVISGTVSKGPLNDGTVTAYAVNADGSNGGSLGTTTTDESGNFSLGLSGSPAGAVRVVASGGSYQSEADGTIVTGTSDVSALVDDTTSNVSGLAVTPLTLFVDSLTVHYISAGVPAMRKLKARPHSAVESSEGEAHTSANSEVAGFFGLSGDTPLESILPKFGKADITGSPDGFKVGLALGTLSLLGKKLRPSSPDDLVGALGKDLKDGKFDGKDKDGPIHLGDSGDLLPPTAGTTDFLTALNEYIESGDAILTAGITPEDASGVVGDMAGGISSSGITPPAVGLSAGSSGAVGTMSFDGKQYVFIAARSGGVAVVDVTNPAAPVAKRWTSVYTDVFGSSEVGGVIPVVGTATHPQVLAFAYGSKHVALLNAKVLATGTPGVDDASLVDFQADLPLVGGLVSFSGGSAYIAGGIPDNGRKGVWLATTDGYYLFSLASNSLTTLYPIDSTNQLAENVGGDIAHNLLLAGNYGTSYGGAVQLVDLLAAKSYYMDPTYYADHLVYDSASGFYGGIVDANSVDSAYQVGILTFEDTNSAAFVNLATVTKTNGTGGALNTFVPAAGGLAPVIFDATTYPEFSGSAVDSSTHLALFMAGYSADVAVGQLQDPSSAAPGTWKGLSDWSWYNLSASSGALGSYSYARDPHAAGAVYNIGAGKPFGYLLDGCACRAIQVDMSGFLALPRAGASGDAAHMPSGDPATAGVVTSIPFGP